jgi:hypothetical protein
VCDLRLAVNDQPDRPLYIDVATFGPGATPAPNTPPTDARSPSTGRLAYHEWQAKDGSKRSKHQVIGRVAFGGRPDNDQADE